MSEVKTKKTKKILDIIVNVIIWVIVVFSVLVTVLAFAAQNDEGVPSLFGKSMMTIVSPSMEPTYKVGDLVFVTVLDDAGKQALGVDDIITYHAPIDINGDGKIGDINTHRIKAIDPATGKITTQGDANAVIDQYTITRADIIGTSDEGDRVPALGSVITFLCSSLGFFLCVVLPLVLFFIYELYNFIKLIVAERAKRAPVSKEAEEEIKRRAIEEYLREQEKEKTETPAPAESEETAETKETEETKETPDGE